MKNLLLTMAFILSICCLTAQTNLKSNMSIDKVYALNASLNSSSVENFHAYAPPLKWSEWSDLKQYSGSVNFSIRAWPDASTKLECQVRYYNTEGKLVDYNFDDDWFNFKTGNYVAWVQVRFRGNPTGSSVTGQIQ